MKYKNLICVFCCCSCGKWLNNEQKNVLNFGLQDTDYQREPRWPIELQVLNERVRHLNAVPSKPEPFYQRSKNSDRPCLTYA